MLIASLALPALIHLAPLSGVLSAERLEKLYGAKIKDPNVLLAMRHRAVIFGVLGLGLIAAMVWPSVALPVIVGTILSDLAFLVLALMTPDRSPQMTKVLAADVFSLICLGPALVFAL